MEQIQSIVFNEIIYGRLSNEPVSFSNGDIIYKNLEIKGFGIDAWIQGKTGQELDETWNGVLSDIQNHKLKVGYDQVYPLAEFKRAIEDYNKNGRRIILK